MSQNNTHSLCSTRAVHFGEYRDGDHLVVPSSNSSDYLTVVGAYADATRLDYIEYYNADDSLIAKRLVTENDTIPNSDYHFFAWTSQNDVIDGGQADSISVTGYLGDDQILAVKDLIIWEAMRAMMLWTETAETTLF